MTNKKYNKRDKFEMFIERLSILIVIETFPLLFFIETSILKNRDYIGKLLIILSIVNIIVSLLSVFIYEKKILDRNKK